MELLTTKTVLFVLIATSATSTNKQSYPPTRLVATPNLVFTLIPNLDMVLIIVRVEPVSYSTS